VRDCWYPHSRPVEPQGEKVPAGTYRRLLRGLVRGHQKGSFSCGISLGPGAGRGCSVCTVHGTGSFGAGSAMPNSSSAGAFFPALACRARGVPRAQRKAPCSFTENAVKSTRGRGVLGVLPARFNRLSSVYQRWNNLFRRQYRLAMQVVQACNASGTGLQCKWYRLAMQVVQACNASGTGLQCEWYRLAMRVQSRINMGEIPETSRCAGGHQPGAAPFLRFIGTSYAASYPVYCCFLRKVEP